MTLRESTRKTPPNKQTKLLSVSGTTLQAHFSEHCSTHCQFRTEMADSMHSDKYNKFNMYVGVWWPLLTLNMQ